MKPAATTTRATRPPARFLAAALVAAALFAAALAGAGAAAAGTITLGRGLPPWRLGQHYMQRPGLVRFERYRGNAGPGCVASVGAATRIDYYRGLRVAWRSGVGGRLYLIDVATTRAGDRSADGFVVGSSPIRQVRRRHEGARFAYGKGPLALGAMSLTLFRRTAKETFATLVYWFDARGVLTALEALAGGC
jgi:hypothetical protein